MEAAPPEQLVWEAAIALAEQLVAAAFASFASILPSRVRSLSTRKATHIITNIGLTRPFPLPLPLPLSAMLHTKIGTQSH